jgi:deoxyribonuclease-4
MSYIGVHTSIAKGLEQAAIRAHELGATAFALFTKNQRRWSSSPISDGQAALFVSACSRLGFSKKQILPHDSYLINLGNSDPEKRKKSLEAFVDELQRCATLQLDRLNFHPGTATGGADRDRCIRLVAESLDEALERTESVFPVIETTAGQGNSVGSSFEEIAAIIERCRYPERLGVCIDTCHIFAAGYDIRTREAFERTMERFFSLIGEEKLMGMHLNDSKTALGSHVDRHESLGSGTIGTECFASIAADSRFSSIPLILETPDSSRYASEISYLQSFSEGA